MAEHYAGDETNVKVLAAGILAAYDGHQRRGLRGDSPTHSCAARRHPTLGRGYLECAYAPMVELLAYLAANGFSNYIASGGGRDFMRPISQEVYGIPRQRVIGSSAALAYTSDERGGTITHKAEARLPRRRPAEADPHLEPHRPPAAAGGRQLQRRRPDAALHPAPRQAVTCACSSCTTTTSANSPTPAEPSRRSTRPPATAGRSSASRTTGSRSSERFRSAPTSRWRIWALVPVPDQVCATRSSSPRMKMPWMTYKQRKKMPSDHHG